jgi:hypothetical protein
MKTRPILFTGPMVKAILAGKKTQTRRVMKRLPFVGPRDERGCRRVYSPGRENDARDMVEVSPYGKAGDRLWVRETHWRYGQWVKNGKTPKGNQKWKFVTFNDQCRFTPQPKTSDRTICGWYSRPSIFLPTGKARINLEVLSIRVEQIQEISEADAKAEGAELMGSDKALEIVIEPGGKAGVLNMGSLYRYGFQNLWESINGARGYGWCVNPWVWVVTFRRVK